MSWLSLLVLPVVHGLILVVTALFWWSRPYYSRPYYSRSYYGGHILIMVVTALLWWSRPYYSRPYYGGHGLIIHGPIIHGLIMVVTALLFTALLFTALFWWSRPYYHYRFLSLLFFIDLARMGGVQLCQVFGTELPVFWVGQPRGRPGAIFSSSKWCDSRLWKLQINQAYHKTR